MMAKKKNNTVLAAILRSYHNLVTPTQRINLKLAVRQILFLSIIGKFLFKMSITWGEILFVLASGFVIEHMLLLVKERKLKGLSIAAVNTSLSTMLMLSVTNTLIYPLVIFIGLLQKHVLRIAGHHFLNPSNVAILLALLFFPNQTFATSLPLGATNLWWLAFLVYVSGGLIARAAGVLPLAIAFLASYIVFAFLFQTRNIFDIAITITSGNFILYTLFMVTDPKAMPKTRNYQFFFAVITAFFANALPVLWGPKYVNLFLALFAGNLLVPVFRWLETAKPQLSTIALRVGAVVTVVAAVALYLSSYNYARNLSVSFKKAGLEGLEGLEGRAENIKDPGQKQWLALWSGESRELYKTVWKNPHVVSRPLGEKKPVSDRVVLQKIDTELNSYKPTLMRQDLGGEYFPFAAATAGDINHDGYLDLALSKVRQKLRVYFNNRNGDFVDVTSRMFDAEIPADVEYAALADFDSDSWLDLLVIFSQYRGNRKNTIYFFDPQTKRFKAGGITFGVGKRSSGGATVWDLNGDKKLDFYVSYGLDWLSEKGSFLEEPFVHEFYLSEAGSWKEALSGYFPPELSRQGYIGMTVLFTDFNQDGQADFLLGNDSSDPSFTLVGGKDGTLTLIDKDKIEQNTRSSMSYFPADFDNDGIFELFEVGISFKVQSQRRSTVMTADAALGGIYGATSLGEQNKYLDEFARAAREIELGIFACERFANPYVAATCADKRLTMMAQQKNDIKICERIIGRGERAMCRREVGILNRINLPNPLTIRFDAEKFPKKVVPNSLLKLDKTSGRYKVVAPGDDAAYSNWTWTAYPFDLDNDGKLDIYLTSGAVFYSHDRGNKVLVNQREGSQIRFTDKTQEFGGWVNDDTRGVIIADFRNSGAGDLVLNNFMASPVYFQNQTGGDSIVVELRSKNSNYYAIGAQITLVSQKGKQIRELNQGGSWNSAQPPVAHFGIANGDAIGSLIIRWPDGHQQAIDNLSVNTKYIVYE